MWVYFLKDRVRDLSHQTLSQAPLGKQLQGPENGSEGSHLDYFTSSRPGVLSLLNTFLTFLRGKKKWKLGTFIFYIHASFDHSWQ